MNEDHMIPIQEHWRLEEDIESIYGHDTGQNNHEEGNEVLRGRVGRRLAAIGRGASSTAAYVEPVAPTCITGSTTDWFKVSAGLANGAESKVENDAAVDKHKPVRLIIGGRLREDTGLRIRRPVSFQGMTRKEANKHEILEVDFVMEGKHVEQQWKHWNESSEKYLGMVEGKVGQDYIGRGAEI
eukprot:15300800-Heterocapsa_arctica.AAC.1